MITVMHKYRESTGWWIAQTADYERHFHHSALAG